MSEGQWIELTRDVEVVQIPAGHVTLLPRGTAVVVTQALGGTYTLHVQGHGGLVRLGGKDADAIGEAIADSVAGDSDEGPIDQERLEAQVWEQLKSCYDPEIPVNIVDLGLVYDLQLVPAEPEGRFRAEVKMTLTAQGCGMGGAIAADAQQKLLGLPGIADAQVDIVWSPIWNPNMISPDGRRTLGMD